MSWFSRSAINHIHLDLKWVHAWTKVIPVTSIIHVAYTCMSCSCVIWISNIYSWESESQLICLACIQYMYNVPWKNKQTSSITTAVELHIWQSQPQEQKLYIYPYMGVTHHSCVIEMATACSNIFSSLQNYFITIRIICRFKFINGTSIEAHRLLPSCVIMPIKPAR